MASWANCKRQKNPGKKREKNPKCYWRYPLSWSNIEIELKYKNRTHGGQHSTMDKGLALHPVALGLILCISRIFLFILLRFIDGTAYNSGQRLEPIYNWLVLQSLCKDETKINSSKKRGLMCAEWGVLADFSKSLNAVWKLLELFLTILCKIK